MTLAFDLEHIQAQQPLYELKHYVNLCLVDLKSQIAVEKQGLYLNDPTNVQSNVIEAPIHIKIIKIQLFYKSFRYISKLPHTIKDSRGIWIVNLWSIPELS